MNMKRAAIVGTGLYLPDTVRTNEWFEKFDSAETERD
jgi:hypothetical protein